MTPTFGMTGNWRELEGDFVAIGSTEFPRAVAFALDETAKAAAAEMTARLPTSLGRKVPGGWQPTASMPWGNGYRRSAGLTPFEGSRLPHRDGQVEGRVEATRKGGAAFAAAMRTMGGSAARWGPPSRRRRARSTPSSRAGRRAPSSP